MGQGIRSSSSYSVRDLVICAAILTVASGCAAVPPAAAPTPRTGLPVSAAFERTWSAVIDVFASRNIPIKTLDKSSGFIATEEMALPGNQGIRTPHPSADCGKSGIGGYWQPTNANYNIRVKPEAGRSSVQVSVFWKAVISPKIPTINCTSNGSWESDAEAEIKRRAESR